MRSVPEVASTEQTVADLRAELDSRDLVRHLAYFYRSPETQRDVAATYVEYGLTTNHRCLYLADDNSCEQVKSALRRAGIDVNARIEAEDLLLYDAADVYLDAEFAPDRLVETLEEACAECLDDGYEGLWVAGENTWSFHTEVSFDHVLDFEADFDATCPDLAVTALCQYDVDQFNEESIAKALWTHEQIIYRNAVCDNPYYVPPTEYRAETEPYLNAELMLEQLFGLTHARREVERREQRLAVVNRVLRHNIRNEMNVVHGYLDLLGETASLSIENRRRLNIALAHIEGVVETASKARRVQDTLGARSVEPTPLPNLLERAGRRTEDALENVTVHTSVDPDVTVLADVNLDTALVELLTTVLSHQQATDVTLRVTTPSVDVVQIDIHSPGLTVSATDRQVLTRGKETPLEHPDGVGLWFVNWVIQNSGGTLAFPDDDRAQIRITLQNG